jgi:hypothetical protein
LAMANKLLKRKNELMGKGKELEKAGHSAAKKHAKKAAKKHAAKHAKKTAQHMAGSEVAAFAMDDSRQQGLSTAFHHMQRASVVISLMEKGTGEDLRDLLARGVKLYERASEGDADERILLRAIGLLRAAEHLALAGLYAARDRYRQKVKAPDKEWQAEFMAEIGGRLERIEGTKRGKGPDLFPATVEMLRQAEGAEGDPHMAYELAMSADALCFALENGL